MIYCAKCNLPPEYCEWAGRAHDLDDCKKWLAEAHPALFSTIYVVEEEKKDADGEPVVVGKP